VWVTTGSWCTVWTVLLSCFLLPGELLLLFYTWYMLLYSIKVSDSQTCIFFNPQLATNWQAPFLKRLETWTTWRCSRCGVTNWAERSHHPLGTWAAWRTFPCVSI
jgi:hypothetical protein